MKFILLLGIMLFRSVASVGASVSPELILLKADEIRNPSNSYLMDVEIRNAKSPDTVSHFKVSIQGNNKTLIETLGPPKDRGRNMLMIDENMWVFIPNLGRAVRVGLNQKLTGEASNGDIARMRWSGDYDAKIEKESAQEWILFLTANKKGLTYEKIRIWVQKKEGRPTHAEFLTLAGKILKTAQYGDYRPLAGMVRPNTMIIRDAIRTDDESTIRILRMEVKSFPDSLFSQNTLK